MLLFGGWGGGGAFFYYKPEFSQFLELGDGIFPCQGTNSPASGVVIKSTILTGTSVCVVIDETVGKIHSPDKAMTCPQLL